MSFSKLLHFKWFFNNFYNFLDIFHIFFLNLYFLKLDCQQYKTSIFQILKIIFSYIHFFNLNLQFFQNFHPKKPILENFVTLNSICPNSKWVNIFFIQNKTWKISNHYNTPSFGTFIFPKYLCNISYILSSPKKTHIPGKQYAILSTYL